jgi:hypothetical protein
MFRWLAGGNFKFLSCYFFNLTRLDDRGESVYSNNEMVSWYSLCKCVSLLFNTFKAIFGSAINVYEFYLVKKKFLNLFT